MRAYHSAVELFAFLCKLYKINPLTGICSHKEGGIAGIEEINNAKAAKLYDFIDGSSF